MPNFNSVSELMWRVKALTDAIASEASMKNLEQIFDLRAAVIETRDTRNAEYVDEQMEYHILDGIVKALDYRFDLMAKVLHTKESLQHSKRGDASCYENV